MIGARGAAVVVAAAACALAGCSASGARTRLRADLDALAAERSLPAPSSFGVEAPGIVHCHTRLSHDSPGLLEEVVAGARRAGVRWVCLTDHTNPAIGSGQPRGEIGGVLVVPGQEISTGGASVLALGASAAIAKGKTPAENVEAVRALGGVAVLGHVAGFRRSPPAADGIAVYDLSDAFRAVAVSDMVALLSCLASGDPRTAAEASLLFVPASQPGRIALWDRRLAEGPCAGLAETNAHGKFRWFGNWYDPYDSLFGIVRNHVLVESMDEPSLLDALRRGRAAVAFDAVADATGARFEALRGDAPAAAMGDAVPLDRALSLSVLLPIPASVRVLRDGRPWRSGRGRVLHWAADGPGVYRAVADLDAGGERRRWILFNPIRVLPPSAP